MFPLIDIMAGNIISIVKDKKGIVRENEEFFNLSEPF